MGKGSTRDESGTRTGADEPDATESAAKRMKVQATKAAKGEKQAASAKAKKAEKQAAKGAKATKTKDAKGAKGAKAGAAKTTKATKPKGAKAAKATQAPEPKPPKRAKKSPKPADPARAAKQSPKPEKSGKPAASGRGSVPVAAAAAGTVLSEVAGLVRQAAEPAAARIVSAVGQRRAERLEMTEGTAVSRPAPQVPDAPADPGDAVPHLATPAASEGAGPPAFEPAEARPAPADEATRVTADGGATHAAPVEPATETLVNATPDEADSAAVAPDPEDEPWTPLAPESPGDDRATGSALEILPLSGVTVGASVDVGANSVHLLVAAVGGHRLEPLVDESIFLGLGDRIDAVGYLGAAARGALVAALVGYADAARRLGATEITFVGTEPMRRAADAGTVSVEVQRASGVPLHVLGHEEEGMLTLVGVTAGAPVLHELVVVDVGGGSSEIVIVGPDRPPVAAGVAVGSARLTQRLVRSDPPSQAEINALAAEARRLVGAQAPAASPQELVAVGGTVSNLLKVLPAAALERVLTRRRITVALAMLATEPSAQASERHAVNPTRARILPAGAVIVQALLEHYGLERLRVSEDGIREGAILVAAHAGRAWRDRLPELALGWRQPPGAGGNGTRNSSSS